MRSPLIVAAVAALVVCASGCRKAKVEEKDTSSQVRMDGGDITLSSSGGTVGLGGKLPDDFPKDVPVYPGANIIMATRSSTGKPAWSLTMTSGDDTEHVMAFYRTGLKAFTTVSDHTMGDTYMAVWQSPRLDVTLLVAKAPAQETSISMTVAGK
jgi:hypothetical protein